MKKLLSTGMLAMALFAPVFAQSEPSPNVNVEVTAPAPAPAPAPNVNVDVAAPAPSAPVVESTTNNSETKIIDHTTAAPATDNTAILVLGGVIGVVALGVVIMAANKRS